MVSDLYADALLLAGKLQQKGLDIWAHQIEDSISGGATATEILMKLRWILQQLVSQLPAADALRSETYSLAQKIGTLLG